MLRGTVLEMQKKVFLSFPSLLKRVAYFCVFPVKTSAKIKTKWAFLNLFFKMKKKDIFQQFWSVIGPFDCSEPTFSRLTEIHLTEIGRGSARLLLSPLPPLERGVRTPTPSRLPIHPLGVLGFAKFLSPPHDCLIHSIRLSCT